MTDVDNLKQAIAKRIKLGRAALGHTQKSFCEEFGMPLASLKNYEGAKQIPGGEAVALFVCAGINANWLLTGEGVMLDDAHGKALSDMVYGQLSQSPLMAEQSLPESRQALNPDAMVQAIVAIFQVAKKGESVELLAKRAVGFYRYCELNGLIAEDDQGEGVLDTAA